MGNPSCLLYLVDAVSSRRYLVDSGSAYSIIPHKSAAAPTGPRLITANGTPLKCLGHRTCTVLKHAVEHLIETTASRPVASRYRRLDPEQLAAAKAEFAAMESQGIIQRSRSS